MTNEVLMELVEISKRFPGVMAVDRVNIKISKGEVHAILGENGAGKSTLMNIMFGYYPQDGGKIFWKGNEIKFDNPLEAQEVGIGMVHQENSLLPDLDVQDNIFLGHFPVNGLMINRNVIKTRTLELLNELYIGDFVKPDTIVHDLTMAQKQLVEIAKALSSNPQFIMFDEPTASLTSNETEILMKIIKDLKEKGVGIIYVTHRLNEIFGLADTVTILRDGKHIISGPISEFDNEKVIKYMVGRQLEEQIYGLDKVREDRSNLQTVLKVENLTKIRHFNNVSFDLKRGEILGFAGLVGAGRSEVLEAIFGYEPADSGEIYVKGDKIKITHPMISTQANMGLIPEERKLKGLFLELSVKDNINVVEDCKSGMFINRKKRKENAEESVKKLEIKTSSIEQAIMNLSGGNQQKVILSRWLLANPEILLVDEPTHGIDVGAKAEIYKIIDKLTNEGISILLVPSELPELILLCDRIAIMYHGKMVGILNREEFSQERIMSYATGQLQNVENISLSIP